MEGRKDIKCGHAQMILASRPILGLAMPATDSTNPCLTIRVLVRGVMGGDRVVLGLRCAVSCVGVGWGGGVRCGGCWVG